MELDRTFEERDQINGHVVAALDEAAANWGVKVLRYEIKDLTPPKEILHAMQAQITAEREKRAVIATSEGKQQEQINLANGAREAAIAKSEGEKQAEINNAQGQAAAMLVDRRGERRRRSGRSAEAIEAPGGMQRGQPQGGRAVHRRVRRARADRQHADRAVEPRRPRGPGRDRDDGVQEPGQVVCGGHRAARARRAVRSLLAGERDRRGDHRDEEHERPRRDREAEEQPALLGALAAALQHLPITSVQRQRLQHVVEAHPAGGDRALAAAPGSRRASAARPAPMAPTTNGESGVDDRADRGPGLWMAATRKTTPIAITATRWNTHSGQGSRPSPYCSQSAHAIRPAQTRKPST